jgi:carboxyl-terminal processing protease
MSRKPYFFWLLQGKKMHKTRRYLLFLGLFVDIFLFGGVIGIAADRIVIAPSGVLHPATLITALPTTAPTNTTGTDSINLELIDQAWKDIQDNYVDRPVVKPHELTYAAISGMVNALGDTGHSRFLTPDEVKQMEIQMQGQYEGVGLIIKFDNNQVVIITAYEGAPAQKAGIKPDEIIQKIDGLDVTTMTIYEVPNHIMGPAGTQVTLTIYDPTTRKSSDITLTRAHITIPNVTWTMIPGTTLAYINIASVADGIDADVITDLHTAQQQNATGIVLDLRDNIGGELDQAISVVSQFKGTGLVMEEKDAQGTIVPVGVNPGGIATKIPVVVLINQGTASAGEIIAVALQDGHRGTLIGQTTYGTGTVLNGYQLADGSELLLAVEEWLTPTGVSFWHKGVVPDIQIDLPDGVNPLTAAEIKGMTADQLKASQDAQLLKGIDVLTGAVH